MANTFDKHTIILKKSTAGPVILAGDIGGTKTNFGLFCGPVQEMQLLTVQTYPSQTATSAIELIDRFLKETGQKKIDGACFGVAGPVINGVAQIVNLPWEVSEEEIKSISHCTDISIINDLVATIHAVPYLKQSQLLALDKISLKTRPGNIGMIAAGTGLGQAILIDDNGRYIACASEGGHRDFAARSDTEYRLYRFLAKKYSHVSIDRILSGRGLADLYDFLREDTRTKEPELLSQRFKYQDKAAVVTQLGLAGEDPICGQALSMFVEIYGAEAGNLALQGTTLGGMYIGGGIAPKIAPAFASPQFLNAFSEKGRLSSFLRQIPVRLVTDTQAALWGAAAFALTKAD